MSKIHDKINDIVIQGLKTKGLKKKPYCFPKKNGPKSITLGKTIPRL